MITGCPDCPHQGDGNSQAGLQAHINRVPGPTVVDAALALAADRPSVTDNARAACGCDLSVGPNALHIVDDHDGAAGRAETATATDEDAPPGEVLIDDTDWVPWRDLPRYAAKQKRTAEDAQREAKMHYLAREELEGLLATARTRPTETTTATVEDAASRLAAAEAELDRLCSGGRFIMSVPPREGYDSDLLIQAALTDLRGLLARPLPDRAALIATLAQHDPENTLGNTADWYYESQADAVLDLLRGGGGDR